MEQTPEQISSAAYFTESLKNTEEYLKHSTWRSGPAQERFNEELRERAAHYKIVIAAQTSLYEHGQKVELPEETKKFLAYESDLAQRARASKTRVCPRFPNDVEAIHQCRVDMGLAAPMVQKPQVREELPEVPHIPRGLPVITGAGSYQHQQEQH